MQEKTVYKVEDQIHEPIKT